MRTRNIITTAMTLLYFLANVPLVHAAEANFWTERRKSVDHSLARRDEPVQLARLPVPLPGLSAQTTHGIPANTPLPSKIMNKIPSSYSDGSKARINAIFRTLSPHGTIRTVDLLQESKSAKTIIHIQDVHQNKEAQENISKALEALIQQKQVELVALEGAFRTVPLEAFREFPHPDIVRDVTDQLWRDNKISGPVYAGLKSREKPPVFVGVEDVSLYEKNVKAYRRSIPLKKDIVMVLDEFKDNIDQRKEKIFGKELTRFDDIVSRYQEEKMSFGDYVRNLSRATPDTSPQVDLFLEALDLEQSLDFPQVRSEQKRLIAGLTERLTPRQLKELMRLGLAYRGGHISHGDFYTYLKTLCENSGLLLKRFPSMESYIRYSLLSGSIEASELYREARTLEENAYHILARTKKEKALVRHSRWAYLAGKLIHFSLTRDEWNEWKGNDVSLGRFDLRIFESFYESAEKRDVSMVENLMNEMERHQAKTAVLVTGGFHTEGLVKALRQPDFKQTDLISFAPQITKIESPQTSAYLSVFNREKAPLEKLFQGQRLFLAAAPIQYTPAVRSILDIHRRRYPSERFLHQHERTFIHNLKGPKIVQPIIGSVDSNNFTTAAVLPSTRRLARRLGLDPHGWVTEVPLAAVVESWVHWLPFFPLIHPKRDRSWGLWLGMAMIYFAAIALPFEVNAPLWSGAFWLWVWVGSVTGHAVYNQIARWINWKVPKFRIIDDWEARELAEKAMADYHKVGADRLNSIGPLNGGSHTYPARQDWGYFNDELKISKVTQIGPLVFVFLPIWYTKFEKIRQEVTNARQTDLFKNGNIFFISPSIYSPDGVLNQYPLNPHAQDLILQMLAEQQSIGKSKRTVVINDSGDGIHARIALAMGSNQVVLIENNTKQLERARAYLNGEGYEEGFDYLLENVNVRNSDAMQRITEELNLNSSVDTVLIDIGGHRFFDGANSEALRWAMHWGSRLILNSGFAGQHTDERDKVFESVDKNDSYQVQDVKNVYPNLGPTLHGDPPERPFTTYSYIIKQQPQQKFQEPPESPESSGKAVLPSTRRLARRLGLDPHGWVTEVPLAAVVESWVHWLPFFPLIHPKRDRSWGLWLGMAMIYFAAIALPFEVNAPLWSGAFWLWVWLGSVTGHAAYNQIARWMNWKVLTTDGDVKDDSTPHSSGPGGERMDTETSPAATPTDTVPTGQPTDSSPSARLATDIIGEPVILDIASLGDPQLQSADAVHKHIHGNRVTVMLIDESLMQLLDHDLLSSLIRIGSEGDQIFRIFAKTDIVKKQLDGVLKKTDVIKGNYYLEVDSALFEETPETGTKSILFDALVYKMAIIRRTKPRNALTDVNLIAPPGYKLKIKEERFFDLFQNQIAESRLFIFGLNRSLQTALKTLVHA